MERRKFLGSLLGTLAFGFLPFSFLAATKKRWEPPAPEVWAVAAFDVLKQQVVFARIVHRDFEVESLPMDAREFVSLGIRGKVKEIQHGYWRVSLGEE